MDKESDNFFTLNSIIHYIRENIIGLLLLILVFFIIYFVDYINYLNSFIFSSPLPMILPATQINPKKKNKKINKH